MIITLNTREDSKEEIKKVIQMLMRLIDEMPSQNAAFEPVASDGIFGLFDNSSQIQSTLTNNIPPENKDTDDKIEIYDY